MKHQTEAVAILQEIIGHGLLHIRAAGWAGDAETCAAIADHLHNLPSLCGDFSVDQLLYYWDVERASFAERVSVEGTRGYQDLWDRLERLVASVRMHADAKVSR